MQHLLDSVRHSISTSNLYSALSLALALPDIAATLDGQAGGSGARYTAWFNQWARPKYTADIPVIGNHVFLEGADCYALRCAFLHLGDFDITQMRARDVLHRFHFTDNSNLSHNNYFNDPATGQQALQLNVASFCEDICKSVEEWLAARGNDPTVAAAIAQLPKITKFRG